jgi:hypothetical protein
MISALKQHVIPELRQQGFKGSFLHYRRIADDKIDLLMFQFNKWGGSFVVEISVAYLNRKDSNCSLVDGQNIDNITVSYTDTRYRLGATLFKPDYWFEFNESNVDMVAQNVVKLLPEAYKWWSHPPI